MKQMRGHLTHLKTFESGSKAGISGFNVISCSLLRLGKICLPNSWLNIDVKHDSDTKGNNTYPFCPKHSQTAQRSQERNPFKRRSGHILRVPLFHPRNHSCDTLNRHQNLQSTDDTAPTRISASQAFWTEERFVEK